MLLSSRARAEGSAGESRSVFDSIYQDVRHP